MKEQKTPDWRLIGHSHQIADTGDYDGHYEITNGKISLLTQDDDDESLQPIVDALNDSGCKFYQDDYLEFENKILKDENAELRGRLAKLQDKLRFENDLADDALKTQESHIDQLRNQIADLERENNEYRAVYDSVVKNRDELSGQLQSETESRKHWQRQAQRYQKYHKELNSPLERVKELEARLLEISEIDEEDDIAWGRMKEIRADDYDLESEREEEIFQFAFFEGIKYVQKALKK